MDKKLVKTTLMLVYTMVFILGFVACVDKSDLSAVKLETMFVKSKEEVFKKIGLNKENSTEMIKDETSDANKVVEVIPKEKFAFSGTEAEVTLSFYNNFLNSVKYEFYSLYDVGFDYAKSITDEFSKKYGVPISSDYFPDSFWKVDKNQLNDLQSEAGNFKEKMWSDYWVLKDKNHLLEKFNISMGIEKDLALYFKITQTTKDEKELTIINVYYGTVGVRADGN